MWDFNIRQALALLGKTMPFILLRLAVYFGITLAYILVTGGGAGIGWSIGHLGDEEFRANATMWGGIGGLGLTSAIMYWAREYLLYMIKAGHIAVMVELMDGRPLPEGRSQISHATAEVKSRFAEASILFGIDQLIKGVLRAVIGSLEKLATMTGLPGLPQIMTVMRAFLQIAVGFIDEVILAYMMRTNHSNNWAAAKDGLVLYTQNYKILLKNAAWLTVIIYLLSFLVFLVMLAPAALLVYLMPGSWTAAGMVIALLLAWSVKVACFDPFAIACLMQVYFKTIEGQATNHTWESKLDSLSDKFSELKRKALNSSSDTDTGVNRES